MYSRLFLFVAVVAVAGCGNVQQRPDSSACSELSATSATCSKSSYITLESEGQSEHPTIAFIEFNDDGLPFDITDRDTVIGNISALSSQSDRSLLMVTFIHGWHHNAAQTDRNVIEFKSFLRSLQKEEQNLAVGTPRSVVGIYIGWQGKASESSKLANLLSYRKKKELGLETGRKSVIQVVQKLQTIRESDHNSRLVLVGHSFGGGVLYSAIKEALLEKLGDSSSRNIDLFGDLVILMNPAVEAQQFEVVHSALNKRFPECTPISMVSFTSEADTALSDEFPRGMRLFYRERLKGNAHDALITTAYGRYTEFSNYELRIDPGTDVESTLSRRVFNAAVPSWRRFRMAQSSFDLGGIELFRRVNDSEPTAWQPVLNVLVDKSLIGGHNEIWNPEFLYFLRALIGMEFAKLRQCG